ncbi:hypothetical protein ACFFGH_25490 [Lysobacter korlensis]|uniref:Uncharacterized protein n=1 Tax=Lysobacter korlensis TaxID=553636 RepID=A0ABV6RW35_9GAMM
MASGTLWRTWKPYAAIAVAAAAGFWWWNDQSAFATLKDGSYACTLVDIGADGKYTLVTDSTGARPEGAAEVQDGEVVRISASGGPLALDGVTIQPRGTTHFRVIEGHAGALADPMGTAIACTLADG